MSKKYILGCILLLILIGFGIFTAKVILMDKNDDLTIEDRILYAITENNSGFLHDNKPVIEIDAVSVFEDRWYVATVKSIRATDEIVPVKVVLLDTNGILRMTAGPDTHFTETELLRYNIPDSVILELRK